MKNQFIFSKKLLASAVATLVLPGLGVADDLVIDEIVVTAQKRAESLQDVPVSVSAFSSDELQGLKLRNTTEIASQVPNLQISTPYGDSQPYLSMRGITTSDYSHGQSSPVAMYVDEVYKSVGALQSLQIYDLERIEVLRGPQGTLYGKNATGGAVNFITKKPDFEEQGGYLTLGIGNYSKREAKGAYQLALVDDTLAARAAFTLNKMDGWVDNKFPGNPDQAEQDEWAARLSFLYQPSDSVNAVLRLSKSKSEGQNYGIFAANIVPADLGYTRSHLDFHENEANWDAEKRIENTSVSLAVNWDIDDTHTLTYIAGYDEGEWITAADDDGSPVHMDENNYRSEVDQMTHELRVASDYAGPFNWIGGLYWGKDEVDATVHYRFFDEFPGILDPSLFGFNEYNSMTQVRESFAAFLHTTYDISDTLSLTFGLRYSQDDTEIQDFYSLVGGLPSAPTNANPLLNPEVWTQAIPFIPSSFTSYTPGLAPKGGRLDDFDFDDDNVSGKIGLDWKVTDDVMLYISYSEGYRSGAVNGQAFFDVSELTIVEPEEIESWEIGFKSKLFANRVQLNGAVFRYDYTNQQFIDLTTGGLQVLFNADKSEITGAELELTALLSESVTLRSGLGYLDAEYEELMLNGVDLSGNELIAAPELNFNFMVDWTFAQTDWGQFALHIDTVYSDDQFFDAPNTKQTSQDGYWLTNARLSLESADDKYSVALWAKNLADEEFFLYGLPLASAGFGFDYMVRGTPRTFGLEATYRF